MKEIRQKFPKTEPLRSSVVFPWWRSLLRSRWSRALEGSFNQSGLKPTPLHIHKTCEGLPNNSCCLLVISDCHVIDGIFTCHVAAQKLVTSKCVRFTGLMKWYALVTSRGKPSSPYTTRMTSSRCWGALGSPREEGINLTKLFIIFHAEERAVHSLKCESTCSGSVIAVLLNILLLRYSLERWRCAHLRSAAKTSLMSEHSKLRAISCKSCLFSQSYENTQHPSHVGAVCWRHWSIICDAIELAVVM